MLVAMSRLWSTVRPIRGRLFLGLLSALAASIVALLIPQVLEALGYQVEWHAYQMQHSLCLEEVQDIAKWIRKVVG